MKQKKNFTKNKNVSSRKDLRKQLRKEKKAKKNDYFKNKKKKALLKISDMNIKGEMSHQSKLVKKSVESPKRSPTTVKKVKVNSKLNLSSLEEQNKLQRQEVKEKAKLERGMIKIRKKVLLEANKNEDKEIKKLEKHLKLNKRKTKTIPKSFADEGLDYLLEVCDTDKLMDAANVEMNLQESGSEFEDDFAVVTEKRKKKDEPKEVPLKKKKSFYASSPEFETSDIDDQLSSDEKLEDSFEEMQDKNSPHFDEDFTASDADSVHNSGSEGESIISESYEFENKSDIDEIDCSSENSSKLNDMINSSEIKKPKGGVWEDIYGRMRDKEGNVIQAKEKSKYVPPHLRSQQLAQDAKKSEELTRLKKQLKGLINRLAVSNMHSICNQIDELYMRNSRNDMNDTLLSLISEALVGPVLTAERLVMEHTMLIAILHANVGMEVGAHFLQTFVQKFDNLYKEGQDVENKELDNIVLIISHLYNFKVFHAVLMYNILDKLTQQFTEKEVELILLVLRSVGFSLRKDDPLALKDLVLNLQKKANESNHLRDNPRVRFMLDILLAVKNNNMAKIPQYDPSHSENLKKLLKTMIHKSKYVTELKVTLEDLLKADERGRWWIVGSAWSGAPSSTAPALTSQTAHAESQYSQSVLDLARKQRINTDTRRNIFCILMTAEDYLDAFEKLLRLGLKAQQEQEIIHVLVHCLLQEKKYNPYYAHLATHFCQADRKHQMTIQYHLWDRLKELSKLSQSQITNLSKFLAHLFLEKALPISVLKVMQFSEMDKQCVRLLRQVLLSVLLHDSTEVLAAVFTRVSRSEKLHMFRESLRLFLHHFVLRNVTDLDTDQAELLKDRVRLAETALTKTETSKLNFF